MNLEIQQAHKLISQIQHQITDKGNKLENKMRYRGFGLKREVFTLGFYFSVKNLQVLYPNWLARFLLINYSEDLMTSNQRH